MSKKTVGDKRSERLGYLVEPKAKKLQNGFKKLKGMKIEQVSDVCANHVTILAESIEGKDMHDRYVFVISAEVENGIPVMKCAKHKEVLYDLPRPVHPFPFPR